MPSSPQPSAASRVGRYLLYERLGSGGMGEVHRARVYAAAGVVKELCIKRVRKERLETSAGAARFIEEARLWMGLGHANIVAVFDFGRAGDEYFLAMEWVDGSDLRRLMQAARASGQRFAPEVVAHVGACVARALAYAHGEYDTRRAPVVHGDVKPENVLISRAGEVKLTDFGAAALAGGWLAAGTRAYMAPEQVRGALADPRADLYALGVMMHEMLAGDRRGEGAITLAEDALGGVVMDLLAEDVGERPTSAKEVAVDLEVIAAEARSRGGVDPIHELAERARAAAAHLTATDPKVELGPDTSYLTDGLAPDFRARMTGSTVDFRATTEESHERPASEHRPRRRRWVTAGIALGLGVASLAVVLAVRASTARPSSVDSESAAADRAALPAHALPAPSGADGDRALEAFVPLRPEERGPETLDRRPPAEPAAAPPPATAPPRAALAQATPPSTPRPRAPRGDGAAATATATATNAPASPGTLSVNAVPWAHVVIDGRSVGDTPLFDLALAPGEHEIRLENPPLGAERRMTVAVPSGGHRDLVVDLH